MDFKICEDVSALGIKVAFLAIYDLDKSSFNESLKNEIRNFYTQFLQNYSEEDLENDVNILGYRKLHEEIGVTDKSLVASPESLIKILFKYKSFKPINYIVDTYNYIAIKNRVSLGAHDIDRINGNVRLCFTEGAEKFIPLGKKKQQHVQPGEYSYMDDSNEILCKLDCRQCDKTKTTASTNSCLFIIQGHNDIPSATLESTAQEIQCLFSTHMTKDSERILKIM